MADYYPLISRAIAGLDPSAPGESRRALYERARSALIAQLRSVQPPLTESEITRERLSLEEAVRKVESEAAQRARGLAGRPAPTTVSGRSDTLVRGRGRANVAEPPPEPAASPPPAPAPFAAPPPEKPALERPNPERPNLDRPRLFPLREDAGVRQPRNLRTGSTRPTPPPLPGAPRFDPNDPLAPTPPPEKPVAAEPPAVRGFRDATAEVDDLGRAATRANRAARRTFANVPSPSPEFDRIEPSMEDRGAELPVYHYDEQPPAQDDDFEEPKPSRFQLSRKDKKPKPEKPAPVAKVAKPTRTRRAAAPFPLKSAIAIGAIMILVGVAILWGPRAYSSLRAMLRTSPSTTVETSKDGAVSPRPKIADRVGQPGDQIAPVAQRVVLYDEDPSEPAGKQYVGSVVWRTEPVKAGGGATDISVRADIEIPERKFRMTMSFRRNTDSSLPASHTAELTFALPPDFVGGGVSNVPGILMKSNEQARGTPLAGLAVKVTDGFFLVGLSNVEADRARNLQLLKERSWFDIPLVYANQRRAIVAIEKGSPGERAFNDAFAKWGE